MPDLIPTPAAGGLKIPAALFPGEWPVLALGPFTVTWDGIPVAIGHRLTLEPPDDVPGVSNAGRAGVRWHDGTRWHYLADDFPTTARVTGQALLVRQPDGRAVQFRPVTLADASLLVPTPQVLTTHGLVRKIREAWNLS